VLWPAHGGRGLATVEESGFRIWGVEVRSVPEHATTEDGRALTPSPRQAGSPKVIAQLPTSELPSATIAAGCWDPHTQGVVALAAGTSVSVIDTRAMKCVPFSLFHCAQLPSHVSVSLCRRGLVNEDAHVMPARDVQYNPKRPHSLVTCGDGCKIKFWDTRSMVKPLLEFGGHTHWVWQARFNPFHDQLVLSGGSDNIVNLWRVAR
jgi:WD40 repeat protein